MSQFKLALCLVETTAVVINVLPIKKIFHALFMELSYIHCNVYILSTVGGLVGRLVCIQ